MYLCIYICTYNRQIYAYIEWTIHVVFVRSIKNRLFFLVRNYEMNTCQLWKQYFLVPIELTTNMSSYIWIGLCMYLTYLRRTHFLYLLTLLCWNTLILLIVISKYCNSSILLIFYVKKETHVIYVTVKCVTFNTVLIFILLLVLLLVLEYILLCSSSAWAAYIIQKIKNFALIFPQNVRQSRTPCSLSYLLGLYLTNKQLSEGLY